MDPDDFIVTAMTLVFYTVLGILLLIIFIKISVIEFASTIPVVNWFISGETSVTSYNYKLPQIVENPYSAAIALAGLGVGERKLMEHSAESAYYGSLASSNSGILSKENGPLALFMRSYNIPFKAELKGIFSVSKDGMKVNIGVNMPVMYKDRKWDILVGLHG